MTAVTIHNAETHWEPSSGRPEPDRTFDWANHGLSSNSIDRGTQPLPSLASPAASPAEEYEELRDARVNRFLADEDTADFLDATVLLRQERRKRALGEVDGIMAGFKFLGKIEWYGAPNSGGPDFTQSDGDPCGFGQWQAAWDHKHDQQTAPKKTAALPVGPPPPSTAHSRLDERSHNAPNDETPKRNSPVQPTRADDKAWRGLWSLKTGMEAEFQRFSDVAAQSTPSTLRQLHAQFPNSKALVDRGILVYRDVLEGPLPDTLADVFAFASVSHAVSEILVGRKRMQEAHVLSGLARWRDCIQDAEERELFNVLAPKMWPQSCASLLQREGSFKSVPLLGDLSPLDTEDGSASSESIAGAACATSTDTGCLSANPFDPGQPRMSPADLEQYVLDVTALTEEEFNFSFLRNLVSDSVDMDSIEQCFDPHQQIPDFGPPHTLTPAAGYPPVADHLLEPAPPPIRTQIPSRVQSPGLSSTSQSMYEFRIIDKVFDCPSMNLRNTSTFLAVLAFAKDVGDHLYRLSGSGMTAVRRNTGSATAIERSKAERRLRREFFDPLKQAGADDSCFLALLSVAKMFVVLGLLRTEEEVQDYLITVSKVRLHHKSVSRERR